MYGFIKKNDHETYQPNPPRQIRHAKSATPDPPRQIRHAKASPGGYGTENESPIDTFPIANTCSSLFERLLFWLLDEIEDFLLWFGLVKMKRSAVNGNHLWAAKTPQDVNHCQIAKTWECNSSTDALKHGWSIRMPLRTHKKKSLHQQLNLIWK